MLRTDTYLLRLAWTEYVDDRPPRNSDRPGEPLVKVWRRHHQLILACWRGLMQSILPHSSWDVLEVLLDKRELVRQLRMEKGGWLFTRAGRRRKRWFKGLRKPNPKTLREEIAQADRYYRESLGDRQHASVEAIVLASSGAVYSAEGVGCATTRLRVLRRVRHAFPTRLSFCPRDKLQLPRGILQKPPFSRRLRR